jgi:hypothetical protein
MAKPIRKTPTLTGKYASQFIEKMLETERRKNLTRTEKELAKLISDF